MKILLKFFLILRLGLDYLKHRVQPKDHFKAENILFPTLLAYISTVQLQYISLFI